MAYLVTELAPSLAACLQCDLVIVTKGCETNPMAAPRVILFPFQSQRSERGAKTLRLSIIHNWEKLVHRAISCCTHAGTNARHCYLLRPDKQPLHCHHPQPARSALSLRGRGWQQRCTRKAGTHKLKAG